MHTGECGIRSHCVLAAIAYLAITIGSPSSGTSVGKANTRAQSATAILSGTVSDEKGSVIAGADVTITRVDTGLRRQVITSNEGHFSVALLPPDRYTVTVQHKGFATAEVRDVVLNVNDQRSLRIELKVGQVSESLSVEGATLLKTQTAGVSTLVDRQFLENLPLNGRTFNALLELTPGSVLAVATENEPGQFNVNGQRQNANYFMIDGVSANVGISAIPTVSETSNGSVPALTAFGGTNGMVSQDAMLEFRIQTSTYAPEFGRCPGAQVSIVTRSGSNEFHGSGFEYLRNEALDANDWFANKSGLPRAKLRQNDFGGVFGGPIRRNRTFFFASYEGLRLLLPHAYDSVVPSLSARKAAIPPMQPFLNAFPIPNRTDFGNGLAQFVATDSSPSNLDATSIRIDHILNSRMVLFGRYNYAPSDTSLRDAQSLSVSQIFRVSSVPTTLTIGGQYLAPRFTNDLRVNYSRVKGALEFFLDDFGGAVPPSSEALKPTSASNQDSVFFVNFGFAFGLRLGEESLNYQRQLNIVDNVAAVVGSHQLGFGVDYRRLMPISGVHSYESSTFFNGINKAISGLASGVAITANFGRVYPVFTNFSVYAQDSWRVNQRLTLTYGLRWELNPPPHEANGNDAFTVQGLDRPATMTLAPQGAPLWETTFGNWAPRVGVAYLLSAKSGQETVVRGGFGTFYDVGNGPGSQAIFGSNYPHSASKLLTNVQFPLSQSQLAPPAFSADPPYPMLFVADPHLVLPRTYEWNIAIERSLGTAQTVSTSYVGAAGRRLLRQELLHPNELFTDVLVTRNGATSDYNALQVQYQRRLSRGLQAIVSYTWSHSIDVASTESSVNTPAANLDPNVDRGNSDFDVRHSIAAAATYDLPSPGNSRLMRAILGNWSLDSMLRARSATPVYVIQNPGLGPLFGVFGVTRPNLIQSVPLYLHDTNAPGGKRINPAAFAKVPAGQQGSLGRNVVRAFPASQLDFAVRRQFAFAELLRMQMRAEFFNIFNHPNFAPPESVFGRVNFGRSTSMLNQFLGLTGGLNPLYQIGGPRSIQLAIKLLF